MKYLVSVIAVAIAAPLAAQQAQPAQPSAPAATTQSTATIQAETTAPTAPIAEPNGGYAPAEPAIKGTPQPGSPIVFQAAPPPSVAFPAPAPLEHYPICKRGRTDHCRQLHDPGSV